jgi:putative oxidoreductase
MPACSGLWHMSCDFTNNLQNQNIMKTIRKAFQWGTAHHPQWLVVIRVLLGLLLFAKGIDFIQDTAQLQSLLQTTGLKNDLTLFAMIIAGLHLAGGIFIILGLFTRLMALIQLPVLFGAIWINQSGIELIYALSIFLLLLLFLLVGGGPVSMDRYNWVGAGNTEPGY